MNQNFIENADANPENQNRNQVFREQEEVNGPVGPIELSILERVENGLIFSEDEVASNENKSLESEVIKNKYEGPKEIIFVSGWININSVYQRYLWGFISKIVIGKSFLKTLNYSN